MKIGMKGMKIGMALAACLAACAGARPLAHEAVVVSGTAGEPHVSSGGEGSAVPVVFVHGLGSNLEVWRAPLDHLRRTRRAIAYDARGHGRSEPARDGDYGIDAMAGDLDRVVTSLRVERFWLVGHSMAGEVISAYAGMHPEKVAGLVYVDAVGDLSQAPEALKAYFNAPAPPGFGANEMRAAFTEMLGDKAKPATRAQVLESVAATRPEAFLGARRAMTMYSPAAGVARYQGPKVCIDAEGNDFAFRAAKSFSISRVKTLANVSHWLMLDDPAGFVAALDEVLQ